MFIKMSQLKNLLASTKAKKKDGGKPHTLYQMLLYRAFGLVIIKATLFHSSWTMKYFFYHHNIKDRLQWNRIKNCKLQNVPRGEKSKKKKVKTQNEKMIKTDMDIWQ